MYMILSKMFDWFTNKNKRLQSKIEKYIDLENQKQILKSDIDDHSNDFVERKSSLDELLKSESDQSIKDSVQERYDNYVSGYIVEIGDLKRRRDKIENEMNNLIKGDEDFLNLVKKEKEVRKFKSILSKYRNDEIDLSVCDTLIKAVSKKKVDYADNLVFNEKGQLLLLKRSELAEFKPGHYTIPGGHVDSGEDFETAAKRELLEESGIKLENVIEVGKYENEDVCIHYFRSDVVNVEPVLQEEEIWSYEWVDPKELEKYKMMDNMRDNIVKILFPIKHQIITINKSFESGVISENQRDFLLENVLEKAKSGIYKPTNENKKLGRVGQKYGNKKEVSKYQKIKDYAERIIKGEQVLKRLSPEEEQGRLLGGSRNVEATIILGTDEKTGRRLERSYSREEQEVRLKEYAKQEGIWIEDYLKTDWGKQKIGSGGEAFVYRFDDNSVYKVHHFPFEQEPLKFCDRIALHNTLFPEVPYEVIGFTKKDNGVLDKNGIVYEFSFIIKQPFVLKEGSPVSQEEMDKEMKKRGLPLNEDTGMYQNNDYIIGDLHPGNVLRSPKGNYMFIDPLIELNTQDSGYGGKRELGEIKIEKSEYNDLNKALESGIVTEEQYNNLLEKAWKKHPIGTVITRKDGQKYKKISETGNSTQDWKLVSKDKVGNKKDGSEQSGEAKQVDSKNTNQSKENLSESAKNASETALNNAIKQSPDPEVRQSAHEELKRREEEEKPKEEKVNDESNDLEKLEEVKQKLLKKVDELSKLHKKLYSNMDIESPKSEEEKKSEKEIANIFSEINSIVLKKRNIIKEKGVKKSEEVDIEKAKDQIKGGLADKLSIEQIAEKHGVSVKSINKQIKKGIKVEMEHTDDKDKAAEIAKDHLTEDPKYYTRLAKMEDEAKKENKENGK